MSACKRRAVWCAALCLLAAGGVRPAAADEAPYTRTRDVIYGRKAGMALTMDVYRPKARANGAAIIGLCSGDWMSDVERSEPSVRRRYAEALGRGYTVFAVGHSNFPVFPPDEIVPDVHRAVRFIRHHAGEYGVDADRLAIVGESSGGHLAAHVGASGGKGPPFPAPDPTGWGRYDPLERESSRVAAFIDFCGPTDLLNYEAEGKSVLQYRWPEEVRKTIKSGFLVLQFRDYHPDSASFSPVTDEGQIRRRLKALSPASLVTADSSPGLLVHGEKDENVPVRQAELLASRLRAAGVPVDLTVRKGVGHGVYQDGDAKLVADWLDKHLPGRKAAEK